MSRSISLPAPLPATRPLGFSVGAYRTVSLLPFGFAFFVYGVSLTLVSRYGRMSTQLEKRTERLHQKTEQLALSLEELKHTQRELVRREQLAMVGELAAVIAHEVRNPLAIVGNAVASLRRGKLNEDDRARLLGIIDEEMHRLERLVSDLLNYARPVLPQHAVVDLGELLRRSLAVIAVDNKVETKVSCPEDGAKISADGELLRLAFENIITNAVQAMDGKGELSVNIAARVESGCEGMAVSFADSGEGMSDAELRQAMSPFFTTRPTGTGLGLPICDRIIEAHGGALTIDSKPEHGTTVTVLLPASQDQRLPQTGPRRARISLLP